MKIFSVKRLLWPTVLVFLATFIGLRTANGAIHPADPIIMLISVLMPTPYALVSVGLGSVIADLAKGFTALAPATLIIKLLMVLAAKELMKTKRYEKFPEIITAPALLIPVPGYYIAKVITLMLGNLFLVNADPEQYVTWGKAFAEGTITFRKDLVQAVAGILIYFVLYHLVTSFVEFRKSLKEQQAQAAQKKQAETPQEEQE